MASPMSVMTSCPPLSSRRMIELKEYDGFCSLSGTMAWCASTLCTFAEALHDYESSLFHARQYMSSPAGTFQNIIDSSLRALSIIEYENMKVACLNTHLLASSEIVAGLVDMVSLLCEICFNIMSVLLKAVLGYFPWNKHVQSCT